MKKWTLTNINGDGTEVKQYFDTREEAEREAELTFGSISYEDVEEIELVKDDEENKSEKDLKDEFTEIKKSLQELSEILARIEKRMGIEKKSIREN